MRLVDLFRRRKIAYDLLARYDEENMPYDPERLQRAIDKILAYAEARQ